MAGDERSAGGVNGRMWPACRGTHSDPAPGHAPWPPRATDKLQGYIQIQWAASSGPPVWDEKVWPHLNTEVFFSWGFKCNPSANGWISEMEPQKGDVL